MKNKEWKIPNGYYAPTATTKRELKSVIIHSTWKFSAILSEVQTGNNNQRKTIQYHSYHRARRIDAEPITRYLFGAVYRLFAFAPENKRTKTQNRCTTTILRLRCRGGWNSSFQPPFSVLKNWNTGGRVKVALFWGHGGIQEVSPCPFYRSIVQIIFKR